MLRAASSIRPASKATPYVGARQFKRFLRELQGLSGFSTASAAEAKKLLTGVNIGIASAEYAIKGLPVTKSKDGFLRMGDMTVGYINKVLREGDLQGIINISKQKISITSADITAFKRTVGDTPEKALRDVTDLAATNKRARPYLDTTVERMDKLSKSGKADVKKIENTLLNYFKTGTTIALTLGVVYVGVDWLSKATEERKGCFMLTTINNQTTSCKVQTYSCIGSGGTMCPTGLPYHNTTLMLMNIATLPDSDHRKIEVAKAANVHVSELNSKLATVIDNKYKEVTKVINAITDKPTFDVCGITHPDIENGIVPPCRLCSPSDNPTSTTFIDASQYGDNITFHCSINPSILDTVADVAKKTGIDLFYGVNNFISGALKPIFITACVILVLLLIISVIFKIAPGTKNKEYRVNSY